MKTKCQNATIMKRTLRRIESSTGDSGYQHRWKAAATVVFLIQSMVLATPPETGGSLPELTLTNRPSLGSMHLKAEILMQPRHYYTLLQSSNLLEFNPIRMARGTAAATTQTWEISIDPKESARLFWVTRELSIYEPADSDNDGIDDAFEFGQSGLNPADPSDAASTPAGGAKSWLEIYRTQYGRNTIATNATSREISIFNMESLKFRFEASSREVSIFNLQGAPNLIEAISREVSVNVTAN